jgi:gephyrin
MVEDTRLVSTSPLPPQEETEVQILKQMTKGENVRETASDVAKGDLVARMGDVVSARGGEIGTLVFIGRREVSLICNGPCFVR